MADIAPVRQAGGVWIGNHLATVIEQRQLGMGQKAAGGQFDREIAQGQIGAYDCRAGGGASGQSNANFAGGEKQVGIGADSFRLGSRCLIPGASTGIERIVRFSVATDQIQIGVEKHKGSGNLAGIVALHALRQIARQVWSGQPGSQQRMFRQRPQQEEIAVIVANEQGG